MKANNTPKEKYLEVFYKSNKQAIRLSAENGSYVLVSRAIIKLSEVAYITSQSHYFDNDKKEGVMVRMRNKDTFFHPDPLYKIEEMYLPFLNVHRSYLINSEIVGTKYLHNHVNVMVEFDDGTLKPIVVANGKQKMVSQFFKTKFGNI